MNYFFTILLFWLFDFHNVHSIDIKGFDDTILFDITWPGAIDLDEDITSAGESVIVTSSHDESYKCILPNIEEKETSFEETYTGPSPLLLISPLFTQSTCSFRLESYWTYEVCHGRYIRQYHEDREGKKVKLQEYILGQWDEKHLERMLKNTKDEIEFKEEQIPVKKIDNVNLPYFEITMENGTLCDLNENKPRVTKVLYVCYIHGKHEVYSLKEISTCVYEIIILSPLLCSHPKYKPKETGEHKINCIPLDGTSSKPYNLLKLRAESAKLRRSSDLDRFRVELIQIGKDDVVKAIEPSSESKIFDTSPVQSFLLGDNCLNGGTGWWKFEFCYGKSVEQYHIEKDGSKVSINLGIFNKEKHLDWISKHQNKRPKPLQQRKQLSHFYSDGTICDKTGKPRQTEVKLKCLENPSSANAVSLYLLEPKYCEYILGVESPLICDILARADENGLVEVSEITTQEKEDISSIKIRL